MSRLPFELLLALRYLRPKRTFVSVITLISVLGVTLGVAVLIIVISVMSGFDRKLRDTILGFNTHVKIFQPGRSMSNYPELMRQVSSNQQVKAVAPFVMSRVLLETQPHQGQSQVDAPYVRGIDPRLETNISVLPSSLVAGVFDVSNRGLLIGREFADQMNLDVGDVVTIYSPEELRQMREKRDKEGQTAILPDEYEIRGIFDVGYYEYNLSVIIASLEDAQELYLLGDDVHGLLVMLNDPYQAMGAARDLMSRLGPQYRVTTWMEENANILNALIVEKNVMFYLLFFIMIVAALCILSALITFVVQKTREIGMLKALGATDLQVSLLFLSQGALVGAIGDLAGYGLGMLALAYRNEFLHFMNRMTGFELFPRSIYGFAELPALIEPKDILLICGSAWVVCTLGGVIPAWRAGRLKPVEALRYE
ncbi:MAG TPA: FtsX-like permease family protein [Clostridia bacterium]|nr:FtsX-like permease family protein [Clostridia bacterium]